MRTSVSLRILIIFILLLLTFPLAGQRRRAVERGDLSVFFMQEKVGYEEYVWEEYEQGYTLTVKGRMTKPVDIEVTSLKIEVDRNFIPRRYSFQGTVSGVKQEISSVISDGSVVNTILVKRQRQTLQNKIRRDAFLLPNPFYAPYLLIAKKYGCTLEEKVNLSGYIIPQLETPFTLEPSEENPCLLIMEMNGIQIELVTNASGQLSALQIPAQNLVVTNIISSSD